MNQHTKDQIKLAMEIYACRPEPPPNQPQAGAPFIEWLRYNPTAGEELKARVTVHVCDTLDARFRTITDDEKEIHTLDAELDEAAYSAFVNNAIAKALHEEGPTGTTWEYGKIDPSMPGYIGIFHTPVEVLRALSHLGVEKGTEYVNTVLSASRTQPATNVEPGTKCIVQGCTNHRNQGQFHEHIEICIPCWNTITTGKIGPSTNFIADLKDAMDDVQKTSLNILKANVVLVKEREDLQIVYNSAKIDLENANRHRDALIKERDDAKRDNERLAEQRDNALGEVRTLRGQLAQSDAVVAALEDKLRTDRNDLGTEVNELMETVTTFRGLLEEVLALMDHQGISTSKHRDRIRDALKIVPPPMDTPMNADFEAWREENECKRCEAKPDAEGTIRHSKGCYVVDANGGGTSSVDPYKPAKLTSTPSVFAVDIAARHGHDPATCENCRGGWGHPPDPSRAQPGNQPGNQPGYANVTSAAVALKDPYEANPGARPQPHPGTMSEPATRSLFPEEFRKKLLKGKYTRWAVDPDIDEETLRLVLWFVGEYSVRGGLHKEIERLGLIGSVHGIQPQVHPRTVGASRVLVALEHGEKMTFEEALRMMEGK